MSSNLRSVPGVISAFCCLILISFVGSAVFYKILSTFGPDTLPPAWQTVYDALNTMYGFGLGLITFVGVICMIIPLTWIFMGKRGREDYR